MLTYIAVASTAAFAWVLYTRKGWPARFAPVMFIGGIHVVYNTWSVAFDKPDTATAQEWLIFGSFIAFTLGTFLVPRRHVARPDDWDNVPIRVRKGALYVLGTIGVLVFIALVAKAGAPPVLTADPNVTRTTFFPSGQWSTVFVVSLRPVAVVCLVLATVVEERRQRLAYSALGVMALLMLASSANRGLAVAPLVTVLLWMTVRFRLPRLRVLVLGAAGIFAFSWYGFQRAYASFGNSYLSDVDAQGFHGWTRFLYPVASYLGGTSSTLDRTLKYFPAVFPLQNGSQFFGPLLHHQSADLYLKSVFGLKFEGFGLALGAMNSFYLDWGYPGVLIGFAFGGFAAMWVYDRSLVHPSFWLPAYLLLTTNMLLANYGHPFAYISTLVAPLFAALLFHSGPRGRDAGELSRYVKDATAERAA